MLLYLFGQAVKRWLAPGLYLFIDSSSVSDAYNMEFKSKFWVILSFLLVVGTAGGPLLLLFSPPVGCCKTFGGPF